MENIEEIVTRIVSEYLGVNATDVKPESRLEKDLNADSIDLVEVVMAIEEEFELNISDDDAAKLHTVGEISRYVRERMKVAQ